MKGFIEVTFNQNCGGNKFSVNINHIIRFEAYPETKENKDTRTAIITSDSELLNVQETYEEIKKKIEEAQK